MGFVSTPAIAQPTSTTQPENDDMIMLKTNMMDDLSLMGWTPENDEPPNNKENSTEARKPSISISYAKIQKVDNLINNDDSTTTLSASIIPSTSTKSRRNVLEQCKKRRRRKEKELEKMVHALQQQLREKEEKQKQKDEYTTELHKSLERCKFLEVKKQTQLDDLL